MNVSLLKSIKYSVWFWRIFFIIGTTLAISQIFIPWPSELGTLLLGSLITGLVGEIQTIIIEYWATKSTELNDNRR